MTLANLSYPDLIGMILGFILTLMIFSYLIGDNPLFRIAIHVFIGVAAALAAVMVVYNVLWPQLIQPLISGDRNERLFVIIPFVLSGLLLMRISNKIGGWGRWSLAFLIGVGVATTIAGTMIGTLAPQIMSTINLFDPNRPAPDGILFSLAESTLILIGVVSTLAYFHFGVRSRKGQVSDRGRVIEATAWVGRVFIAVTFSALFTGVYMAALSALIERMAFIVDFVLSIFAPR